jgi:hypothetical protein
MKEYVSLLTLRTPIGDRNLQLTSMGVPVLAFVCLYECLFMKTSELAERQPYLLSQKRKLHFIRIQKFQGFDPWPGDRLIRPKITVALFSPSRQIILYDID